MCDCGVNSYNDCDDCNSGCSPCCYNRNRSCLTEYPKQTPWSVEEKFSNMVPPSFLCKDPKCKKKPCSCNIRRRKIIKRNCNCKNTNFRNACRNEPEISSDCKTVSEDDNNCRSRNTGANARKCAVPNANLICQDQGPCLIAPNCAVERNKWAAIPAAGVPTKKDVRFDPCTGVEYNYCPWSESMESAPMEYSALQDCCGPCNQPNAVVPPQPSQMFPYCCPNMCCGFPNPTAPSNFNICPCSENSRETNRTGSTCEFLNTQNRICPSILRSSDKKKKSECVCNIKWTEATPKVIERICDSLGVPNPPNNSNILLPIIMSAKGSDREQSSTDLNRETTKTKNATVEKPCCMNAFRPTRSCGCNTEKQTQSQEDCSESDKNANDNNAAANNNNCNNNCRGLCNSSMCCHRPQYTCCYNPYTGYYFWCRSCCCGNSCNTCNPCSTFNPFIPCSCPLLSKEPISNNKEEGKKPEKQTKSKRSSTALQKSKKSKSATDRSTAGSAGSTASLPQPQVSNEELQNQWMSFQNSILMPPPLPPQMPSPNFPGRPNYVGNIIPPYYQSTQFYPEEK